MSDHAPLKAGDTIVLDVRVDQPGLVPGSDQLMDEVSIAVPRGCGVATLERLSRLFFDTPDVVEHRREQDALAKLMAAALADKVAAA